MIMPLINQTPSTIQQRLCSHEIIYEELSKVFNEVSQVTEKFFSSFLSPLLAWQHTSICCFDNGVTIHICYSIRTNCSICSACLSLPCTASASLYPSSSLWFQSSVPCLITPDAKKHKRFLMNQGDTWPGVISLFFLSSRCEVFIRAYALGQMHLLHSPSLSLKHIMMYLVCLCSFAPFCLIANTFLQTDYDSKYHTIAFFFPHS